MKTRWVDKPGVVEAITVIFLMLVGFNIFFGVRTSQNTHRIDMNAWRSCQEFNTAHHRQNKLLDTAIAAERARSKPNQKTIKAYKDFKFLIRDCGPRP